MLVLGIAEPAEALERFAGDLARGRRASSARATPRRSCAPPARSRNEVVVAPRDAFLGEAEVVAVDDAVGRVSAESIAGYPPGIPALLPGERITAEVVAYLRELVGAGARLHGASDPAFHTVYVLATDVALGGDARRSP